MILSGFVFSFLEFQDSVLSLPVDLQDVALAPGASSDCWKARCGPSPPAGPNPCISQSLQPMGSPAHSSCSALEASWNTVRCKAQLTPVRTPGHLHRDLWALLSSSLSLFSGHSSVPSCLLGAAGAVFCSRPCAAAQKHPQADSQREHRGPCTFSSFKESGSCVACCPAAHVFLSSCVVSYCMSGW